MNRIILIGNGFDLANDLKTNYNQFIDWFWEKEKSKLNDKNNWKFHKTTHEIEYHGATVSSQPIQNSYVFEDDFIRQIIEKTRFENMTPFMPPSPQEIIKNIFLKQINSQKTLENWVDIENEYYKALMTVVDNNTSIKIGNDIFKYTQIEKLNEYFYHIKIELEEYLATISKNKTGKIVGLENLIYSKFSFEDFTKKGIDNLIDIAYRKILSLKEKDEKNELSILNTSSSTLRLYSIINALTLKEKPIIHESFRYSLDTRADFVKLLRCNDMENDLLLLPENVLLLNFNYTNTENKYLVENYFMNKTAGYKQEFKINQEAIHIHGELNNPENPIIFGYGDELDEDYKQILKKNDNRLLENVKSVKYGETYNYKKLLEFIESDNYQVFVMGHSCGNSDRTLLNTLFEHENCQSIKIFYHKWKSKDKDTKDIIVDDFSNVYRNIIRNFTDFAKLREKVVDKTNSILLPQSGKNAF
jgi:hypothetical protein